MRRIPAANLPEHDDADQRTDREPRHAGLAERHNNKGREQRPDRLTEIAAELEHRLSQAETAARREPGHTRRFRMEDRRTEPNQHRAKDKHRIAVRVGQNDKAYERGSHADRQRIGQRASVGIHADQRLQQRSSPLESQGEQADLPEVEMVAVLQQRINRGKQRLHHIVDEMAQADRQNDGKDCSVGARGACRYAGVGQCMPRKCWRYVRRRCNTPDSCKIDDAVLLSFGAR